MTLTNLIKEISYNLKGTDDDAPSIGDDDWTYWCVVINRKKDEMYDDSDKNWRSAFLDEADALTNCGTVIVASAPSFNLDDSFISASDQVVVVKSGKYYYYDVVSPQDRNRTFQQCFVKGQNPKKLRFSASILATDTIVGGTVYVPGYYRPADIDPTSATAYIPVDDPHWLAMAVAASIAENDIEYEDKFGDLVGQASVLYKRMTRKNKRGTAGNPKQAKVKVFKIPGFH